MRIAVIVLVSTSLTSACLQDNSQLCAESMVETEIAVSEVLSWSVDFVSRGESWCDDTSGPPAYFDVEFNQARGLKFREELLNRGWDDRGVDADHSDVTYFTIESEFGELTAMFTSYDTGDVSVSVRLGGIGE